MCGICGKINFNSKPVHESEIRTMMQKMKHRGPDDDGFFIDNNAGFGFVRLSILDLSLKGHQPMFDETERYMIIHNGEVYNYIEIREELKKYGFSFRSNTDTEVILKSFIYWGKECLHKFNGMWAFVIYDTLTKNIFGARDRFGVKPFYYFNNSKTFIFASDIPPILNNKFDYEKRVNYKTVYDYFVFNRTDHNENTFYEGIKKLQHGHCFTIDNNKFSIERWYRLKIDVKEQYNPVDQLLYLLEDSIKLRLRSDVPIGVCLSGGLDSSAIVSILSKKLRFHNTKTFSAVYEKGERADESRYIEELKPLTSKMYFIRPTRDTFYHDIDDLIHAHSEPFSSTSIYAQYKVMQLAKNKVTVLLDGQGADEHSAGYHYFYGFYLKELIRSFSLIQFIKESYKITRNTKSLFPFFTFAFFSLPAKVTERIMNGKKDFLNKKFIKEYEGSDISRHLYSSSDLNTALLNHFEYKLEHLLRWEDRNSMWFSLESRVPFLDYRLVEFMFTLSSNQKINNGQTKFILREVLRDIVPKNIINRKDKVGFATPDKKWLAIDKMPEMYKSIILNKTADKDNIFNIYNNSLEYLNSNVSSSDLWKILNYRMWYNIYINS